MSVGRLLNMSEPAEFRHLVRIAGKDLAGSKKLIVALSDLKGVGYNFANVITTRLSLDPRVRLGLLSEEQVKEIEAVIQSTSKSSLPAWYYNRRKDPLTGETKQLLGADLDFTQKNDIEAESDIRSWKGVRHSLGLKVRGQRTRTTGRKGRTVGVRKAALVEAAKAAAASKEEK
jgi:small subunit ribosomal protein S13